MARTVERRGRLDVACVLIPTVLGAVVLSFRMNVPLLWLDEGASWREVGRSWSGLFDFLAHRDAGIGLFYVVMKLLPGWAADEATMRLPALLCMVAAVAVGTDLARRWFGPRVALAAGLALLVMPWTSQYAQEARAYAGSVLLATLALWLLQRIVERAGAGWPLWLAYGGCLVALGYWQMMGLLTVSAHLFLVWGRPRAVVRRWLVVVIGAGVVVAPLVLLMLTQPNGVVWTRAPAVKELYGTPRQIVGGQRLALLDLAVLAAGLAVVWWRASRVRQPTKLPGQPTAAESAAEHRTRHIGRWRSALSPSRPALVVLAWFFLPLWELWIVGHFGSVFVPRYLLTGMVPAAMALGWAITRWRAPIALAVLAVAVVAVWPQQVQMRTRLAKGPDYAGAAAVIAADCRPGDAVFADARSDVVLPFYLRAHGCRLPVSGQHAGSTATRLWFVRPARLAGDPYDDGTAWRLIRSVDVAGGTSTEQPALRVSVSKRLAR